MEEIFYKRVEDYIKSKKVEIIQNINQKECSYLLENETEYIKSLVDQFTADPITVDFDDIDYTEEKATGYYLDGTPVDVITYTFKVPFKGKAELLNYRSNKGKYKDKTYFVEGGHIYFKSRNFDLKPVDRRFANTIDIMKSIINNLNKDYVNWNNNLPDFVKRNIETRKNSLMKFKEFCKKHELSKEEIQKMKFKLSAIEALSKIIGETYTGSGITTLFKKAGYPEIVHDGTTKRKFVCETFENMQEESNEGFYKILKVLEVVCDPQEYILNPDLHEEVLEKVNRVLRFYGLKFTDEGILNQLENKEQFNYNDEFVEENIEDNYNNINYEQIISNQPTQLRGRGPNKKMAKSLRKTVLKSLDGKDKEKQFKNKGKLRNLNDKLIYQHTENNDFLQCAHCLKFFPADDNEKDNENNKDSFNQIIPNKQQIPSQSQPNQFIPQNNPKNQFIPSNQQKMPMKQPMGIPQNPNHSKQSHNQIPKNEIKHQYQQVLPQQQKRGQNKNPLISSGFQNLKAEREAS